jgi:hypothetical protein
MRARWSDDAEQFRTSSYRCRLGGAIGQSIPRALKGRFHYRRMAIPGGPADRAAYNALYTNGLSG